MSMIAKFPNGHVSRVIILCSPYSVFRLRADSFLYVDEYGERQHVCTLSVEDWAKMRGVTLTGCKRPDKNREAPCNDLG